MIGSSYEFDFKMWKFENYWFLFFIYSFPTLKNCELNNQYLRNGESDVFVLIAHL